MNEQTPEAPIKLGESTKPSFVYLLHSQPSGHTYIGATMDLVQRLRRHNKEITGGSKRTGRQAIKGETWEIVCFLKNFPTWSTALQFECKWQKIVRVRGKCPVERRLEHLAKVLMRGKSTIPSIPFDQWPNANKYPITLCVQNEAWRSTIINTLDKFNAQILIV